MSEAETSKGKTRDARGRVVRMIDPVTLHILHRYQTIDEQTVHAMVEELEPGTARHKRLAWIIIPGVLIFLGLGIAALYFWSDAGARADLIGTLTNPALMVPNLVCCLVVPWIATRSARMKRIQSVMLRRRRCPHCGYDLRASSIDSADGATICSECGCAWNIEAAMLDVTSSSATMADRSKKTYVVLLLVLTGLAVLGILGAVYFQLR